MKQLCIVSGKGGTGKTSIAASFASLMDNAVIADCDVDAPDLHLILRPKIKERKEFFGSKSAFVNKDGCIRCGICEERCRFGAIDLEDLEVNPILCEGCGVCEASCPEDAISLEERLSGYAYLSETRYGPMAHAKLSIAEEASGKLVTLVRENARALAKRYDKELIIIDGPPGIGCAAIASLSGADLALIVTEPTVSGIHDLERVFDLTHHFSIPSLVCVNRYDINAENTEKIEDYCRRNDIPVVAEILFDEDVVGALVEGVPVVEFSDGAAARAIRDLWKRLKEELLG
jgi:MinD superfamily P-loop ATPase